VLLGITFQAGDNAAFAQPTTGKPSGSLGQFPVRERPYNSAFGPDQQRQLTTESGDIRLSLLRAEPCVGCPAGRTFVFELNDKPKGSLRQFRLSNETSQIDEIRIASSLIAIVIGRVQSSISLVTLMDLNRGSVFKAFDAFDPCVSDDNRLIAFVKPYPIHFTPGVSNEYLVYDVGSGRAGSEAGKAVGLNRQVSVVYPVYPPEAQNVAGDNIMRDTAESHSWGSDGFFWLGGEHVLAFVDSWHSRDSLVVADLRGGVEHPVVSVEPLETAKIVDPGRCSDYEGRLQHAFTVIGIRRKSLDPLTFALDLRTNSPSCPLRVSEISVALVKK
jgi:hypothetical protein